MRVFVVVAQSLEARLTRRAFGDEVDGGGYALSLKSQVLVPCKNESVNQASPVMMSLRNRLYISADEVGDFDSDLVKTLTGGEPITARNMYSTIETFCPRFCCIELLSNKSADKNKRAQFKVDSGIQRRVKALFHDAKFVQVANAEEARTILNEQALVPEDQQDLTEFERMDLAPVDDDTRQSTQAEPRPACTNAREGYEDDDRAYFASFGNYMFGERHDMLMSLRGQLMLILCRMHAEAERPGGSGWAKVRGRVARTRGRRRARRLTLTLPSPLTLTLTRCPTSSTSGLQRPWSTPTRATTPSPSGWTRLTSDAPACREWT
jgi:hypothetical protein